MTNDFSIREAVPGDAPDFASSQVLAWRAAYAGILDSGYLAGMNVERLTQGWARILGAPDQDVRRLALAASGTAVGWSGFGVPRDDVPEGTGELHALNLHPDYWSRGLGSALFLASVEGLRSMGTAARIFGSRTATAAPSASTKGMAGAKTAPPKRMAALTRRCWSAGCRCPLVRNVRASLSRRRRPSSWD